jgi:hypothetical protein
MTMQVIQHQELASAQTSITFSSIPQTFTDLYLVVSLRSSNGEGNTTLLFNGSSSNYSHRNLEGTGSSTSSSSSTTAGLRFAGRTDPNTYTANTFANNSIYIPNYTASVAKSVSVDSVQENNGTEAYQTLLAGLWNDTSAITSMVIGNFGGGFAQYSSATLYGITKGTNGVVVS